MRWNLGLAGLATSWGLIAVLAAAVVARRRAARIPPARARGGHARRRRASRRPRCDSCSPAASRPPSIALGVVQAAHWLLFFEAVKRGSVALAVLTFYLAPLFLAVLAPLFLPERLSNVALGALVPGGLGIALSRSLGDDGGRFGWRGARLRDRLRARHSRCS